MGCDMTLSPLIQAPKKSGPLAAAYYWHFPSSCCGVVNKTPELAARGSWPLVYREAIQILHHGEHGEKARETKVKSIALLFAVPPCRRGKCFSGLGS
jgi:hypothetical protein